jgi:hypothetical protein
MAAQSTTPPPMLVAWDKDPAIVGGLAASTPMSFIQPVSLQRANTVSGKEGCLSRKTFFQRFIATRLGTGSYHLHAMQWKDSTQLQAKAYLRHVAKSHKAAHLRLEWLAHKRTLLVPS